MGLRSYFGVGRAGDPEDRALPRQDVPSPLLAYAPVGSVTTASAMTISDVYAAVRVLADAAASLPLHTYRRTDRGRERIDGRAAELLRNPAPAVTGANLIGTLMAHLQLFGNAYLGLYRGQDGRLAQLGPLSPERVAVAIENGQPVYTLTHHNGGQSRHTTADVVHFRGLSTDGLVGLSPIRQCAIALGLSDALAKHARDVFVNSAVPKGLLKVQRFGDADAQVAELREGWEGRHQGAENAGRVAVVAGEVDYTAVELSPADAEILASRQWSTAEVAKCFRIPAHFLNAATGDSLTYATSETLALDFARFSLAPWLAIIEQRLTACRELLPGGQYAEFELDGFLRSDAKTRAEIYALGLDPITGWMNREEVRRLENLSPESAPEPTPESIIAAAERPAAVPVNGNGGTAS